jgi:steroid 5-alpha reductase family enzyme
VAVWSARLSLHLGIRQRGHGEDPRYVVILRGAKPGKEASFAYTRVFLLQATLAWFISLPLQWLAFATTGGRWLTWLGLVSAVKGLFFEAVGDYQLKKFRERPDASTTVLQTGLWKYTRHPNYFGDALFWWGVFAIVAGTPWGWVFAPAPVLMNWLLTSLSGKPLLERSLKKSKPGYEEYVARTSSFIPWFPKKN